MFFQILLQVGDGVKMWISAGTLQQKIWFNFLYRISMLLGVITYPFYGLGLVISLVLARFAEYDRTPGTYCRMCKISWHVLQLM